MPAANHPILPSPDRSYAPKRTPSTTPYSQGFRFLYRHSRRRLENLWVGPINAALKCLKHATVTPGETPTLSASSASLFLCRCSDAFSSSFTHAGTHAAINLQPPSRTVLYQTTGSSATVLQSPVPNSRRSSATQSVHYFSFPPDPRFPTFSSSPDVALLGNLWSPIRSSALDHNNLLVRTDVSMLSHSVRWRASLWERMGLFGELHQAPRIRSNILWCVVRSLVQWPFRGSMSRIRIREPLLPRTSPSGPSGAYVIVILARRLHHYSDPIAMVLKTPPKSLAYNAFSKSYRP